MTALAYLLPNPSYQHVQNKPTTTTHHSSILFFCPLIIVPLPGVCLLLLPLSSFPFFDHRLHHILDLTLDPFLMPRLSQQQVSWVRLENTRVGIFEEHPAILWLCLEVLNAAINYLIRRSVCFRGCLEIYHNAYMPIRIRCVWRATSRAFVYTYIMTCNWRRCCRLSPR